MNDCMEAWSGKTSEIEGAAWAETGSMRAGPRTARKRHDNHFCTIDINLLLVSLTGVPVARLSMSWFFFVRCKNSLFETLTHLGRQSARAQAQLLERGRGLLDGGFGGEALDTAGAHEADGFGVLVDVVGVRRVGDWAAVGQDQRVMAHRAHRGGLLAHLLSGFLQRGARVLHADAAATGGADVDDDRVGPGLGHLPGLLRGAGVDDGEEVQLAGGADHLHLAVEAQPGLLQLLAEAAVDEADG